MFTLNCNGRLVKVDKPLVMGIINLTPDSFFAGSRVNADDVLRQTEKMLKSGAAIIDIGAQSTRPGSSLLTADEEIGRLGDIPERLCSCFPEAVFSIDSFHARVASHCVGAGFSMINDISGGELDDQMIATAAGLRVPYICMHMRGTPQTMGEYCDYENVTLAVLDYFIKKIEECQTAGIQDIIIDPGFGFSKNIPQNFELLRQLPLLQPLQKPILAGLSRKSTIYKTLQIDPQQALNGTTVLNTIALMNGANILRVHDVTEAVECVKLYCEVYGSERA